MNVPEFSLFSQPRVVFGPGRLHELPGLAARYGSRVLLVTGSGSLEKSGVLPDLFDQMRSCSLRHVHLTVSGEPGPDLVDRAVSRHAGSGIDVVVAIGGGSVLDAGKAISAMLLQGEPVETYIEGLDGYRPHDGRKVPFIAVPTTSGTGSEATNNAVISRTGPGGFKRSLRHPAFIPDIALIDPALMLSLPRRQTVASGMDAGTQLLEAYLSPAASPYTDALAWSGLEHFRSSFPASCGSGAGRIEVRSAMAYAALLSGMTLVNAGLGIVHGFASSIGGFIDIPHGTLCASLLASATRENIGQLRLRDGVAYLEKYARAGRLFSGLDTLDTESACDALVETLEEWQEQFAVERLGAFGLQQKDIDDIVNMTRSKNNPVELDDASMKTILMERL